MSTDIVYDAFISYRRQDPDKQFARKLLKQLEADGYKVAFDERDFAANQPFLDEMERCVKQSRYTLAVVSPQYFDSGNTTEEAVICKVLDMGERKRRLVPLVIEKVHMPTWLYLITGLDFVSDDPIVDPYTKLKGMLGVSVTVPETSDAATQSVASSSNIVTPSTSTPNVSSGDPSEMNRDTLLDVLFAFDATTLGQIITSIPGANSHDAPAAPNAQRVSLLIQYVESSAGPGLPVLVKAVQRFRSGTTPF